MAKNKCGTSSRRKSSRAAKPAAGGFEKGQRVMVIRRGDWASGRVGVIRSVSGKRCTVRIDRKSVDSVYDAEHLALAKVE